MVFKLFLYVFFTTSLLTPYSVVNNKAYAIYGVPVLFYLTVSLSVARLRANTLDMSNHKRYHIFIMNSDMNTKKLKRWIVVFGIINFLLVVGTLVSVLLFWRPWDPSITTSSRKITITGSATVSSEPDEFRFTPSYTRDSTAAITKLNDQIIATLKNLGLKDSQIKNNASTYGSTDVYYIIPVEGKEQTTLGLTITVNDKKLAQKVQDYLLTTNPEGAITPIASFSTSKRKSLENKARGDAIKDARAKATQTATGLGAKLGKVLAISEGTNTRGCDVGGVLCPIALEGSVSSSDDSSSSKSPIIQPGTDELTYSFTVSFSLE